MKQKRQNVAFTITAKNYTHYALTLRDSFLNHNPDYRFVIVIMDMLMHAGEIEAFSKLYQDGIDVVFFKEVLNQVQIPELDEMLLKYNILDMNTAIKPFMFEYLAAQGYSKIVYFDSDIFFKNSMAEFTDLLDEYDFILTPHMLRPYGDDRYPGELNILCAGIYNLGFIALRNNQKSMEMIRWWQEKLFDNAFLDHTRGWHNDQKWMEFVPLFFGRAHISANPGYNAAYWNLHERRLLKRNGCWYANQHKLVFFHFSGLNLFDLDPISKHQNRFSLKDFPGLDELFAEYRDQVLAKKRDLFVDMPYYFDYLPGTTIKFNNDLRRRSYRFMLQETNSSPFQPDRAVREKWLACMTKDLYGDGLVNRTLRSVWDLRFDLQQAYPRLRDLETSRRGLHEWGRLHWRENTSSEALFCGCALNLSEIDPGLFSAVGLNLLGTARGGGRAVELLNSFARKTYQAGMNIAVFDLSAVDESRPGSSEFRHVLARDPVFDKNLVFFVPGEPQIVSDLPAEIFASRKNYLVTSDIPEVLPDLPAGRFHGLILLGKSAKVSQAEFDGLELPVHEIPFYLQSKKNQEDLQPLTEPDRAFIIALYDFYRKVNYENLE